EEEVEGVGCDPRHVLVRVLSRVDSGASAVVAHIEAARLDPRLKRVRVLLVEVELLDQLGELGEVHAAHLLAALHQPLDARISEGLARRLGLVSWDRRSHGSRRYLGPRSSNARSALRRPPPVRMRKSIARSSAGASVRLIASPCPIPDTAIAPTMSPDRARAASRVRRPASSSRPPPIS